MVKKLGWKDIPIGGKIIQGGTSVKYKTGSWRTYRPVLNKEKCINCMRCWLNCPDMSIIVKDEKMVGFDYDFCKGCGLCAKECPVKAVEMILEGEKDKVNIDEKGVKQKQEKSDGTDKSINRK